MRGTISLPKKPISIWRLASQVILVLSAVSVFPVDSTALADDFTVVSRISTKGVGGTGTPTDQKGTEYHSDTKIRVTLGESFDRIEDFATGRVITIDHARKRYYDNSAKEVTAAMQETLESHHRELQKAAKDVPQLAAMLASLDALTVSVKPLPSTRMIAGYQCKGTVYAIGDTGTLTVWSTTALPTRKGGNTPSLPASPLFGQLSRKLSEEMRRSQEGFALSTEMTFEVMGNRFEMLTEALEVRRGVIPPATFAPPPGYTKADGLPANPFGTPTAIPK
jgi:hypothetical protein